MTVSSFTWFIPAVPINVFQILLDSPWWFFSNRFWRAADRRTMKAKLQKGKNIYHYREQNKPSWWYKTISSANTVLFALFFQGFFWQMIQEWWIAVPPVAVGSASYKPELYTHKPSQERTVVHYSINKKYLPIYLLKEDHKRLGYFLTFSQLNLSWKFELSTFLFSSQFPKF